MTHPWMTRPGSLRVEARDDREIVMTRAFDAPRRLVFEALTRPELLSRWFGVFGGWSMAVCEVDLRVGGPYRYVWHGPDGVTMGMHGVHREIVPPERLVTTETFDEPWYAGEAVNTWTFAEQDGRTILTASSLFESREARDTALASGMETGVEAGFNNLDTLLASRQARETAAGRYRLRADAFEAKVAAVRPEQWSSQSPCADWTARDVVRHIVMMHGVMFRPLGRELSPAPAVDDDPLGAFTAARADVEAILQDPALASSEHAWYTGRMTAADIVDQVVSTDMVWHGWDLARATGQDDTIDPEEVRNAGAAVGQFDDAMLRQPGILGPALEPPPGADAQTRLLAFLGRKSW